MFLQERYQRVRDDFGSIVGSTATWGLRECGELLHLRTWAANKTKRSRGSSLRGLSDLLVLNVLLMRYEGFVKIHWVEKTAAEHSWEQPTETEATKRFNGTSREMSLHGGTPGMETAVCVCVRACVCGPWTLRMEEGDSATLHVWRKRWPRHGVREKKRWKLSWGSGNCSNIGYTRSHKQGASYPKGNASLLVDNGCTDHIVKNSNALLDVLRIQSEIAAESKFVNSGCRQIIILFNGGKSNLRSVIFCVWLTIPQNSYQSQYAGSGVQSCRKLRKGTWVKLTQENSFFCKTWCVLEFKMSSNSVKTDKSSMWHKQLLLWIKRMW